MALAVSAGLLCASAGIRYACALRQEALQLSSWTNALRRLTLLLGEGSLPLPEALRQAGAGLSGPDRLLSAVADAMTDHPLLSVSDAMKQHCPAGTAQALLLRLADGLSRGSLESRCLACDQAAAAMAQFASEAAARSAQDAKLWQTLGLTCGAFLTLMLI